MRNRHAPLFRLSSIAVIFLLLFLVHSGSKKALDPAYDRYPGPGDPLWRLNAMLTLQLGRNWVNYGLKSNGFVPQFIHPRPDARDATSPYVSYPPGFVLLPWAGAKILGTKLELTSIFGLGRAFHLLTAMMISLLVFFLFQKRGAGLIYSSAAALCPGALSLLVPAALAYFPFAWWADIIVLPFFFGLIVLELFLPPTTRFRRALHVLALLLGVLTDWLFFLLLGTLIVKDFSSRPRRWRPELFVIPAAYVLLHLALTIRASHVSDLIEKVTVRTGADETYSDRLEGLRNWWYTLAEQSSPYLAWAVLAALMLSVLLGASFPFRWRLKAGGSYLLEAAFLVCVPASLHFLLVNQHYAEHYYESLKLHFMAIVLFAGIIPALLYRGKAWMSTVLLAVVIAGSAALIHEFPSTTKDLLAKKVDLDPAFDEFCKAVYENSQPADIAFSPYLAIEDRLRPETSDPRVMSWSYARCDTYVYLAEQPSSIGLYFSLLNWTKLLRNTPHRLILWTKGDAGPEWKEALVPGTLKIHGEFRSQELKPVLKHK